MREELEANVEREVFRSVAKEEPVEFLPGRVRSAEIRTCLSSLVMCRENLIITTHLILTGFYLLMQFNIA